MNRMYFKYLILLLSLPLISCENLFEEKNTNEWEDKYAWSVSDIAEGVLYNAYAAIEKRPDYVGNNFLDAASDNAISNQYNSSIYKLSIGAYSSKSTHPLDIWSKAYEQFQYINLFLEKGLTENTLYNKTDPEMDAKYKQRLKGEAHFLRAYWGFRLLQVYGGRTNDGVALGYPIVTDFVSEEEAADFKNIYRNSYEECVNQIIEDCDIAIDLLPSMYVGDDMVIGKSQIGRATSLSAMALKSRVSLYAASPAYQNKDVINILGMGDYEVLNNQVLEEKLSVALKAADEFISNINMDNYVGLKASDLADAPNTTPYEFIFRFYYNNRNVETTHFPPYYYGSSVNVPSQNLVDAFPMINGYPIDRTESDYKKNNPYDGRDKRFYLNIYFHGSVFGDSEYPIDVLPNGKDSYTFNVNATKTGYYLSKFLSKKSNLINPITPVNAQHYNPIFRITEILLNYAEVSNELYGPMTKGTYISDDGNTVTCKYSAYDLIKLIREVSGGITDTRYLDEMASDSRRFRELIQNERRIELAFENHRYFDMKRWLLPLNENIRGVNVSLSDNGDLDYDTDVVVEKRPFNELKYYYTPLPYEECIKNPGLVNNYGW